jgi:hypothetical protein
VDLFHSGSIGELNRTFDLITLVHVLEHVTEPAVLMTQLRERLNPGGVILVEVPDLVRNAFDLIVYDHCSHFTPHSLVRMAHSAGYGSAALFTDWVHKELTLLLGDTSLPSGLLGPEISPRELVDAQVAWLTRLLIDARRAADVSNQFGVFGTAIAGTWLGGLLGESVRFFVDEDQNKRGYSHIGQPVFMPDQVPEGSNVYLALPPAVATAIHPRLLAAGPEVSYALPPAVPELGVVAA